MNIKINNIWSVLTLALSISLFFAACVKTEFDEPPAGGAGNVANVRANTTIKALKALHTTPAGFDQIKEDLIIRGIVTMDDKSGNYYKTIVIQDSTAGLEVKFNDGYLFNNYPIGQEVFIKCKDLILSDYKNLTQLIGSTVVEAGATKGVGITANQALYQVITGQFLPNSITPKIIKINEINDGLMSTLVQFDDVQFSKLDTGANYADPVTLFTLNRELQDCSSQPLLVRTSGYADFAGSKTPGGKGKLVCILSVYNTTYQAYIRNTADVDMKGTRCGGGGTNPGTGILSEGFDNEAVNANIAATGWYNIATVGTRNWIGKSYSNNFYAQNSAYNSNLADMESWLITPPLDLKVQRTLAFESSLAYYTHNGLTVWVSNDFNGTDPDAATWTPITCDIAGSAQANNAWIPSGTVTLPIYSSGKGYIGFKYSGDTNTNTGTFRIDNVNVQ